MLFLGNSTNKRYERYQSTLRPTQRSSASQRLSHKTDSKIFRKVYFRFTSLLSCLTFFQSLINIFKGIQDRAKPEDTFILIVILANSAGPIRKAVKHQRDVKLEYGTSSVSVNLQLLDLKFSGLSGVVTQCLRLEKFLAANNQYWNNVAQK